MSRAQGRWAEDIALDHLRSRGLALVARNYRWRGGELDLVCLDRAVLAFVEVRYRQQGAMVGAAESVDARKQRKLRTTASHFLATHREHAERVCRFDVVSVSGSEQAPRVDWLEDAFE